MIILTVFRDQAAMTKSFQYVLGLLREWPPQNFGFILDHFSNAYSAVLKGGTLNEATFQALCKAIFDLELQETGKNSSDYWPEPANMARLVTPGTN